MLNKMVEYVGGEFRVRGDWGLEELGVVVRALGVYLDRLAVGGNKAGI